MNVSFPKLIDGMVSALRHNVLPSTDGEFARGQVFGVIYMLESLRLRAGWSPAFFEEQLAALEELRMAISDLPPEAPRPAPRADGVDLETARNEGDQRVCELIDWLAARPGTYEPAERAVNAYLHRQIKYELSTTAKPMFAEIASGQEKP